ncbi:MAG: MBL fold metallo-hydrolase [Desulfobacterales bacterium]
MSVCILASGSRGNAIYVSDGVTSVLVDAGLSAREIGRRLADRGLSAADLNAILVTHEHTDHVRGVERLCRRFRVPVFLTAGTLAAASALQELPEIFTVACGRSFQVGTLTVDPFSISHDARDPAGFVLGANGTRIGIATDLGIATAVVREHLRGCGLVILESNHDPDMLTEGPYPWYLKQRIRGHTGHLSNPDSGRLLAEIAHPRLQQVVLAHLSETNNTPVKALAEAASVLADSGTQVTAASQSEPSSIIRLP